MNIRVLIIVIVLPLVLTAQQWEPMDFGFKFQGTNTAGIKEMEVYQGTLYVCGVIRDGHGNDLGGVMKWNDSEERWNIVYIERLSSPRAFSFYNNSLYAGGYQTQGSYDNNGGLDLLVNDNDWQYLSEGPSDQYSTSIFKIKSIHDKLYVLGGFTLVNYTEPTYGIAIYDGSQFEGIQTPNAGPSVRLDDVIDWQGDVYVVGKNFDGYPDYDFSGLAKIENGSFVSVHEEFTGNYFQLWVFSLAVFQDKLYIGGWFNRDIGFTGNGIQYFDGEEMHEVGGGLNGPVYDMKVYKGELYVGGGFTRIGVGTSFGSPDGIECNGVAKWDGNEWTCLFDGDYPQGYWFGIKTIEIYQDTLYIGGNWKSMNGDTAMSCIARREITPKPGITTLNEFTLYPNPTNNQLHFDFGYLLDEDAFVKIYNPIGQIVKELTIPAWEQTYVFDTSPLSRGIYIVKVQLGKAIQTKKIIIQ